MSRKNRQTDQSKNEQPAEKPAEVQNEQKTDATFDTERERQGQDPTPATQPDGQPPVESPDPHGSRDLNQPFSDEANNDKPDDGGIPKSEPADVIAARDAADFDIEALGAVERSLSGRANQTAEGKEALIHVRYSLEKLREEKQKAE